MSKLFADHTKKGANNRPYTAEWTERLADLTQMTSTSFDTAKSRKQLTHAEARIDAARCSISIAPYLYRVQLRRKSRYAARSASWDMLR